MQRLNKVRFQGESKARPINKAAVLWEREPLRTGAQELGPGSEVGCSSYTCVAMHSYTLARLRLLRGHTCTPIRIPAALKKPLQQWRLRLLSPRHTMCATRTCKHLSLSSALAHSLLPSYLGRPVIFTPPHKHALRGAPDVCRTPASGEPLLQSVRCARTQLPLLCAAYNAARGELYSAGQDPVISVWAAAGGALLRRQPGHRGRGSRAACAGAL